MADPGFGAAAISILVNELLHMIITAAKRTYKCKKNCKRLRDVLELVEPFVQHVAAQPSREVGPGVVQWLLNFKGLLEEAKVLVQECNALGSILKQIVPAHRLSSKILNVTEPIGEACDRATLATLNVSFSLHNRFDNFEKLHDRFDSFEKLHDRFDTLEKLCKEVKREQRFENVGIITRELVEAGGKYGMDAFHDIKYQVDALLTLVGNLGLEGSYPSRATLTSTSQQACSQSARSMQPIPEYVFGMDKLVEKLKGLLLRGLDNDKPRSVGVWGRGGAGKSLLAQVINNCDTVDNHYGNSVLWLTIGRDASTVALYKIMASFLGVSLSHNVSTADMKTTLYNSFLKRRVLLILDDVWDENQMLDSLDLAKGLGSVTLITTRTQSILQKANAEEIVVMELSEEDSWNLFCVHAFHGADNVPAELEDLARKVAHKCGGLPLALKVVGGAMVGKGRVEEWRVALRRLMDSQLLDQNMEVQLYHCLKMSYDELGYLDRRAKDCFLYFAAFPEDAQIEVNRLFAYWIGEGLVGGEGDDPTDDAYFLLGLLIGRSLINFAGGPKHYEGKSTCSVHDVLRDLALYIIQYNTLEEDQTCLFRAGKGLRRFPTKWCHNTSLKAHRLSLLDNDLQSIPDYIQARDLRTLLLGQNVTTSLTISELFFSQLNQLRVLDLRKMGVKSLPNSLGHLKFLTYLNLSGCNNLEKLPHSVSHLERLQHLDLSHCWELGYVPLGLTKLSSLQYLGLGDCYKLQWSQRTVESSSMTLSTTRVTSESALKVTTTLSLDERRASLEDLSHLSSVTELYLGSFAKDHQTTPYLRVPTTIFASGRLRTLQLQHLSVPDTVTSLPQVKVLKFLKCVDMVFPRWIEGCHHLTMLKLSFCGYLKELPATPSLILQNWRFTGANNWTTFHNLSLVRVPSFFKGA